MQLQVAGGIGIGGSGTNDVWTFEPAGTVALQVGAEGAFTAQKNGEFDPFEVADGEGGLTTLSKKLESKTPTKDWMSIPVIKKTRIIEQRIFDPNLSNLTPLGRPTAEVLDSAGDSLVTSEVIAKVRRTNSFVTIVAEWYGVTGSASAQIWSKVHPSP